MNIKPPRPSDQLKYKRIGLYEIIEKRGKSSYLLKLPPSLKRLHPVFHVSLLEPAIPCTIIPDHSQSRPTTQISLFPEITYQNPVVYKPLEILCLTWSQHRSYLITCYFAHAEFNLLAV